jgi:hypothetical protein
MTNETIEVDPTVPTVRIVRDFDASPDKVFRAWIEPESGQPVAQPEQHHDADR